MRKLRQLFQNSLRELAVTKNMVLCGLLAALAVILGLIARISIGPYIRIGFSDIPNRIVEFLFGPAVGALFGGALDILKYILKPTGPYFFGFTLNAILAGLIYGVLLYQKPVSLKRIVLAEFLVKLILNCLLNTLWLSMLYGEAFTVLFPVRVIKNAVMLPIDSFILYFSLTYAGKLVSQLGFRAGKNAGFPAD